MRRLLAATTAVFAGLVAAGLHGFSLPSWHAFLGDGGPIPELLAGRPRDVRSDDWYVQIPLALAQRAHEPAFPRVNGLIGAGQDVILPIATPIRHPITLFRPEVWGFFLGADVGIAWLWWSRALGLFAVWAWVAFALAGRRTVYGALGGALVLLAPLMQLWSMNAAPVAIAGGLGIAAAIAVLEARSRRTLAAGALALAWSIPAFVVAFYPPYQVVAGWLAAALLLGWLLARRGVAAPGSRAGLVVFALGAAAGLAACAALLFDAREAIAAMAGTVYPGQRAAGGDTVAWWRLASNDLLLPARVASESDAMASARSWLLFPVIAAAEVLRVARGRGPLDPIAAALLAFLAALALHVSVGLPGPLASALGFSWVPASRAGIGFALGEALLLVRFLTRGDRRERATQTEALSIATAWVVALGAAANELHARFAELGDAATFALVLANGALAYAIVRRARPALLLGGLVAASAAATLWWSPLVRGGSSYLRDNALAQRILAVDRAEGGATRWAVFGPPPLPNLLRAIGVRALNGVQPIPQLALWANLDPEGDDRAIYDRYAHVLFEVDRSERPSFHRMGPDAFSVRVAPGSPWLACAGASHVLVRTREPQPGAVLRAQRGLEWLGSEGVHHLFRLAAGSPAECPADAEPRR
jgi:hypothetical protein